MGADQADPLEGCDDEAARFARRGRKFLEMALEFGAIRAKGRHRDEWRAYGYENKLGPKTNPVAALFGESMEKCRMQEK